MHAQDLIALLAERAGLPALRLSPQGTASLGVDERLTLNFEHDEGARRLVAYAVLGALPAAGREALYRRLLEGNLFGRDTGGGTLAVDEQTDELLLSASFDLDGTDDKAFEAALEALVESALAWQHELAAPAPAPGMASGAAADINAGAPALAAMLRA